MSGFLCLTLNKLIGVCVAHALIIFLVATAIRKICDTNKHAQLYILI